MPQTKIFHKECLYVVATPIGNLDDMSTRAIKTLREVDIIAAEDTRHSRKLLDYFAINTKCISLHEYNERTAGKQLLNRIKNDGLTLALICDAGTPLISDPGFHLISECSAMGIRVVPIPGPCAAIAALSAAGLPTDRFVFEGFLPAKSQQRKKYLMNLCHERRTLIFYETPHRILQSIQDMIEIFGPKRYAVIARELTKVYETIHKASLEESYSWLKDNEHRQKGEFVILVHGYEGEAETNTLKKADELLDILLKEISIKRATELVVKLTGAKKNQIYRIALNKSNYSARHSLD